MPTVRHAAVLHEIDVLLYTTILSGLSFMAALEARDLLDALVTFIVPTKDQPKRRVTLYLIKFVFVLSILVVVALILSSYLNS